MRTSDKFLLMGLIHLFGGLSERLNLVDGNIHNRLIFENIRESTLVLNQKVKRLKVER